MLRNEYGAVQQHLEPQHIRDMIIPIPDDIENIREVIKDMKNVIDLRESLESAMVVSENTMNNKIKKLLDKKPESIEE